MGNRQEKLSTFMIFHIYVSEVGFATPINMYLNCHTVNKTNNITGGRQHHLSISDSGKELSMEPGQSLRSETNRFKASLGCSWVIPSPVHTKHPIFMIPMECGKSRQKTMVS